MKKLAVVMSLIVIATLIFASCEKKGETEKNYPDESQLTTISFTNADGSVGTGAKTFTFKYLFVDGKGKTFVVHTDKNTVCEALSENGIIDGVMQDDEFCVKTVDGLTLDKDKDGRYWAFFVDNNTAENSIDKTEIEDGAVYSFLAQ